ncbi:Smr/MutS family protein [Pseudodesulfovibrio piezophilus]|uniref:Smr protein/MutS2 n=1 Tax=Pseudodesulfovibrio piezophilus (strain DSM 21447 / JCM 15486 / C1TLV30) TaxID=1322246 RepID=M1WLC9_PSEP2|nr:Smr/MutS family protein [Pseudodesulfovibrio piezophilus]CCH47645.1 Smr protein/MutS2 [Pseudodesulfovibrio piezophilus C1TLV30]
MGKKNKIKNLGDLKALNFKKENKDAYSLPYEKKERPRESPEPDDHADEALFFSAMQGVKQMDGTQGRQISPQTNSSCSSVDLDPEEKVKRDLQSFLRGAFEFELEYTEDFMYGYVRGLDIKTFQQLKAGSFDISASLDMHGMTTVQAHEKLLSFMQENHRQDNRCVLVVTGKGINSPGGQSVLRRETESWLTHDPLKQVVLAFCTAQPKHGGAGAIYILLRKQKKTEGKIAWDKTFNREEMS